MGLRPATLLAGLVAVLLVAPARAEVVVRVGDMRVERAPFRVAVEGGPSTFDAGAPVRAPGVDGPQPEEPLGALGGYPGIGWVVGARAGATIPVFLWAGKRLFGAEAGGLVSVTDASLEQRTRPTRAARRRHRASSTSRGST